MPRILATVPPDHRARRGAQLLAGLVLFGVTSAMLVLAGLGLDPWDVLHQGLARTFGLAIGTWAIIVSFVVLCLWWPLRQRPGVGTIANAVIIGLVLDAVLAVFSPPHALVVRIALLIGAVAGNGIATGFYIGAGLGPGPRDGLSVAIAGRGHSMRVVRTSIEATVLVVGFLLGGDVGVGTVVYALSIGPITHWTIPALAIERRRRLSDRRVRRNAHAQTPASDAPRQSSASATAATTPSMAATTATTTTPSVAAAAAATATATTTTTTPSVAAAAAALAAATTPAVTAATAPAMPATATAQASDAAQSGRARGQL